MESDFDKCKSITAHIKYKNKIARMASTHPFID